MRSTPFRTNARARAGLLARKSAHYLVALALPRQPYGSAQLLGRHRQVSRLLQQHVVLAQAPMSWTTTSPEIALERLVGFTAKERGGEREQAAQPCEWKRAVLCSVSTSSGDARKASRRASTALQPAWTLSSMAARAFQRWGLRTLHEPEQPRTVARCTTWRAERRRNAWRCGDARGPNSHARSTPQGASIVSSAADATPSCAADAASATVLCQAIDARHRRNIENTPALQPSNGCRRNRPRLQTTLQDAAASAPRRQRPFAQSRRTPHRHASTSLHERIVAYGNHARRCGCCKLPRRTQRNPGAAGFRAPLPVCRNCTPRTTSRAVLPGPARSGLAHISYRRRGHTLCSAIAIFAAVRYIRFGD